MLRCRLGVFGTCASALSVDWNLHMEMGLVLFQHVYGSQLLLSMNSLMG